MYGSSCLVGCVILRQQPVKMLHDLYVYECLGGVIYLASCVLASWFWKDMPALANILKISYLPFMQVRMPIGSVTRVGVTLVCVGW